MFLSFDGVDGVGKSTQIKLLAQALQTRGGEVVTCRDPGGTPLGEKLRGLLLGQHETPIDSRSEMLLYMASRAQLVEQVIRPALEAGQTVISDRYLLANVVYQGYAGGLEPEDVWTVGKVAVGGIMPQMVFLLDMPAERAMSRIQRAHDRLESRGLEYLSKVRDGFLVEAHLNREHIQIIDADRPAEVIHAEILGIVERLLG
jgi:dTMP kinase